MLRLAKVAVTGGLSCGKTTVCRLFKMLGAYVISADEIVHQLLSPHTTLGQQIIQLVGSDIVVNQRIDRSRMAKRVFHDALLLQQVEDLIHPVIKGEIEQHYQNASKDPNSALFIAEIPLLFETGAQKYFDAVIVVVADLELCQRRFTQLGHSVEEYSQRAARQLPVTEKARRADHVLINEGSIEELQKNVETLFQMYRN
jgi:dephospho-CoA kinase